MEKVATTTGDGLLFQQIDYSKVAIEDFLINVVAAFHRNNNIANDSFFIMDKDQKIVSACNLMLKRLGYSNLEAVVGKTFGEIYQCDESRDAIVEGMNKICELTLERGYKVDALTVGNFPDTVQGYFVCHTPLYSPLGKVIGTVTTFKEIAKYTPQASPNTSVGLSFRQAEIIFLLSMGASQKEIASVYGVTRGTIARSIDAVCTKFHISGSSDKFINECIVDHYNDTAFPVMLFKPFITPISCLYTNRHILRYLR